MPKYTLDHKTQAQFKEAFVYHAPKDDQQGRYVAIRAGYKELAELIASNCPPSRELSVALTNLETSMMWANASIARNE